MKIFKDVDGDPYEIVLNIRTMSEIEALTGINLGLPDVGEPALWFRLTSDAMLVSRLIWLSCRASSVVKTHSIREDDFYEDILVGPRFEEAHRLFLEEYRDFFLRRSIGGTGQRIQTAVDAFLKVLNSGAMSTKSQGPSASIPAATASGNSTG